MSKVFIGVGHGGKDSGACGNGMLEKDVNLTMAYACKEELERHGVEVLLSRTIDEDETLSEKTSEANEFKADYALDIHNNAGGGDGFEVFYGIVGVGKQLASNIEEQIIAIGQNSRGLKTKLNSKGNADYFGFIRNTNMPAIIVEGFFIDNSEDIKIADTIEEQRQFGLAYARGILKTLGIEIKEKEPEHVIIENKELKIKTVKVNSTLALRESPTTKSKTIQRFINNTTVIVLEENCAKADGFMWDKVQIRVLPQYVGYMANEYLK